MLRFAKIFLLLLAAAAHGAVPNIVYILADDLDYGDVQALNREGKIATPHMDRLAAEGMIFTAAHSSSSVCTPTTGSRWDIVGRAVEGELKDWTLPWLESTQVKWFAWAAEYPKTTVYAKYLSTLASVALCCAGAMSVGTCHSAAAERTLKGAVISAEQTDADRLRSLKAEHYNTDVLVLDGVNSTKELEAARAIGATGLDFYWIEIGRNPALADAHPEWMASLEVHHPEWRRFFPKFPQARKGEVVKNYPWVPVLYQEKFPGSL